MCKMVIYRASATEGRFMNWQTEKIFETAQDKIKDEGVFTPDQIVVLEAVVDLLKKAIETEIRCISSHINHVL